MHAGHSLLSAYIDGFRTYQAGCGPLDYYVILGDGMLPSVISTYAALVSPSLGTINPKVSSIVIRWLVTQRSGYVDIAIGCGCPLQGMACLFHSSSSFAVRVPRLESCCFCRIACTRCNPRFRKNMSRERLPRRCLASKLGVVPT